MAGPRRRLPLGTILGAVLGLGAAAGVAFAIGDTWDEVRRSIADAEWQWLVAALVLAAAGMAAIALVWPHAVALLGGRLSPGQALAWYFVGEIGKYLPGGVWPVLGRSELARRGGVPATASYGSVLLSLGALYLGAALAVVAVAPFAVDEAGPAATLACAGLLVLGIGALHPVVTTRLARLLRRVSRGRAELVPPSFGGALGLVVRYLPAWVLVGAATWCVTRAFAATGGDVDAVGVGVAAVASWIVGFAAVPVPGGVGVREAVFLALVPGLDTGVAATVAITARLVFMVVDAGGAALGATALRRLRPPAPGP